MNQSVTPMVEVVSLRKDFGSMRAVADISFSVNRGEVVGFLGPNGAGKTTTMRMLTGFLKPSAGSALIQGINVSEDRLGAQRLIGYLPENAPLYDDMIVSEFLDYVAKLRGIIPEKRSPRRKEICERCGLAEVIGKDIGQLSKGYRQRVGLAQAILHDPDLLILDEPTSGLDPNQIVEIRQLIRDLGCEKTVILSTHILPEVQATCGRIIIINDGKLAADDTPDALTEHDSGAVVRLIVKGKDSTKCDVTRIHNVLVGLENIHSVDQCDGEGSGTAGFRLKARGSSDPREAVFNAAISNEFVVLEMHRERASLEDTFRRLTRGEDSNSKEELRA